MTTTTELPDGASWADDKFDGDGDDRGRLFTYPNITVGEVTMFILGVQYANGSTSRSVSLPVADGDYTADFTPLYARTLAAMLQNLADICELLGGVNR
jgi:hypothetical protein